ncbi:hypothetical protein ALC53_01261, partial [Atta colombica]
EKGDRCKSESKVRHGENVCTPRAYAKDTKNYPIPEILPWNVLRLGFARR